MTLKTSMWTFLIGSEKRSRKAGLLSIMQTFHAYLALAHIIRTGLKVAICQIKSAFLALSQCYKCFTRTRKIVMLKWFGSLAQLSALAGSIKICFKLGLDGNKLFLSLQKGLLTQG